MSNSTSLSTTPSSTPNINENVGGLSKSTPSTNLNNSFSLSAQGELNASDIPDSSIETADLNTYQADRVTGSTNSGGDAKPRGTELTTNNSEKATNTAQDAPKRNDAPNAPVPSNTSSAEKSSTENNTNHEINANNVASENSTNNVNGNDDISKGNDVAKVSADPEIRYDNEHKGYWVTAGGIPTIFRDEENAKKFMDIMKDFQLEGESLPNQLLGYDLKLRDEGCYPAAGFFQSIAMGMMQPTSWGFVSGNDKLRNEKIQEAESTIEQNPSKIEETKSEIGETELEIGKIMIECVDPLSMPRNEFEAWQTKLNELQKKLNSLKATLNELQNKLNAAKAELEQLSSFWSYQPTDEAKLIAAKYTKELYTNVEQAEKQGMSKKLVPDTRINNKIKKIGKKANCFTGLKNQVEKIASIVGIFRKIFGPLLNFLERSIADLKDSIKLLNSRLSRPPVAFVKAIVNLVNKPEYQISCPEHSVGGNGSGGGRPPTILTNSLNQAILRLILDKREDDYRGVTVETLNNFAQIYGEETLDKAVRTLYTARIGDIDASDLKSIYEAYWKQSGRKGKCPIGKVFDNKIRELN